MGKLVLDEMRREAQNLIQDRSRGSSEPMTGHFFFADTHPPHGSQDGIVAHGPAASACAGEHVAPLTCERL